MEWFRSAGVGLYSASGSSLLCDPWLNDGALLGSWFHWPPLEGDEHDNVLSMKWDAVYITHLHGDHYDRRFMSKLAKVQPNTKVVIADFAHSWLSDSLENIGFRGRIRLSAVRTYRAFRLMLGGVRSTLSDSSRLTDSVSSTPTTQQLSSVPCGSTRIFPPLIS